MRGVGRIMVLGLLVLSTTVYGADIEDPADKEFKVKGKHKRLAEEAEFFYSVDDHFMCQRMYGDLQELYPESDIFNFRLGFSLLHLRNREFESIPFLEKAAELKYTPAHYFLAEAYHLQGDFNKAIGSLKDYRSAPDHRLTHARIDKAEDRSLRAKEMLANPNKAYVKKLGTNVNSEFQDYAPNIDPEGNKLFFTSRRPGGTGGYTDVEGSYFEDIYVAQQLAGAWTAATTLKGQINSDGHDANVNLSSSGNRMIIYRTSKNMYTGDLFFSDYTREGWTTPLKFGTSVNTDNYHEPSAALSPDERMMYIASDRPGGFGGKDIYVIRKMPNGEWSQPENMGNKINSPDDEDAPFISVDGQTLFYASTGHTSIGGYDIFRTQKQPNGEWSSPDQLGYPVNTVADDIYFSTTADGKKAYLSSSRDKNMDIYEVDMLYEEEDLVVVKGFVTEEGTDYPISAHVTFIDRNNEESSVTTLTNNQTGKYVIALQPDRRYKMKVESIGHTEYIENMDVEVTKKGEFRVYEQDVLMKRD
jgi:hypothetical protein